MHSSYHYHHYHYILACERNVHLLLLHTLYYTLIVRRLHRRPFILVAIVGLFYSHTYAHTLIMNFQKNKLSAHCSFHYPIHTALASSSNRMQNKILGRIILFSFVVLILCLLACNKQKRERERDRIIFTGSGQKGDRILSKNILIRRLSFVVH